jgi:hypothetical protein
MGVENGDELVVSSVAVAGSWSIICDSVTRSGPVGVI